MHTTAVDVSWSHFSLRNANGCCMEASAPNSQLGESTKEVPPQAKTKPFKWHIMPKNEAGKFFWNDRNTSFVSHIFYVIVLVDCNF